MGARVNLSTGGGRRQRAYRPVAEINVTPFVDVMLVLLVIFMITAPLMTAGVEVDLPKVEAATSTGQDEPLVVTISAAGKIFLQETDVELDSLVPRLRAISGNKPDTRIFIRGDRKVDYGRMMEVMSTVSLAGFNKVALVTETPTGARPTTAAAGARPPARPAAARPGGAGAPAR